MPVFAWVVIITAIAGVVGTSVGGLLGAVFSRNSEKIVSLLLSFAGGVMVSVVCLDLISEAVRQNDGAGWNVAMVIGMVAVGFVVVFLLNLLIDKKTNPQVKHIDKQHPKTADQLSELIHSDHLEEHSREYAEDRQKKTRREMFVAGIVMACAIALHNIPEGMVIGASYAKENIDIFSMTGALALAIVIGLHNIPEGMSVSVPLIAGGIKKYKAVLITAATGIPTILGAMLGYFLGRLSEVGLALSLSFASGAMLYVVFGELLPESILMWRSKAPAFAVLTGILVGIVIQFV